MFRRREYGYGLIVKPRSTKAIRRVYEEPRYLRISAAALTICGLLCLAAFMFIASYPVQP